jgi:hypothetical protein
MKQQQVSGLPSSGQLIYYVYVPASILIVASAGLLLWKFTRFRGAALALEAILLIAVLPFMLPYTGGV